VLAGSAHKHAHKHCVCRAAYISRRIFASTARTMAAAAPARPAQIKYCPIFGDGKRYYELPPPGIYRGRQRGRHTKTYFVFPREPTANTPLPLTNPENPHMIVVDSAGPSVTSERQAGLLTDPFFQVTEVGEYIEFRPCDKTLPPIGGNPDRFWLNSLVDSADSASVLAFGRAAASLRAMYRLYRVSPRYGYALLEAAAASYDAVDDGIDVERSEYLQLRTALVAAAARSLGAESAALDATLPPQLSVAGDDFGDETFGATFVDVSGLGA